MYVGFHSAIRVSARILSPVVAVQLLFTAVLFASPGQAGEELDLLPPTETFRFNTRDKFYDTRKYSKDFKIKGWLVYEDIYFGQAKIAGENGPGLVVEKEGYSWGFNHRGAELLIKF
jgi:hypothetical protein